MNACRGADDEDMCSIDKQSGFYHTGNQVQGRLQLGRLIDAVQMNVENQVACFGFERRSIAFSEDDSPPGQRFNLAGGTPPAERNDFDW